MYCLFFLLGPILVQTQNTRSIFSSDLLLDNQDPFQSIPYIVKALPSLQHEACICYMCALAHIAP